MKCEWVSTYPGLSKDQGRLLEEEMPKVRQTLQPLLLFLAMPWSLACPLELELSSPSFSSYFLQINWDKVVLDKMGIFGCLRGAGL